VGKASVLVADDSMDALTVLTLLLEDGGFDVIPAMNQVTAMELIELHHPEVALIDLMMPDMSGIEFIRLLREKPEFENLPVIAMSSYNTNYLVAALLAGATSVMHKPEDLDNLVEIIDQLIGTKGSRATV
jgi:chemosensory pili system protein ChpA (sensor histidine kinase/response regulator)